jgi:hypothetical protein
LLNKAAIIGKELSKSLRGMAGFGNIGVHQYEAWMFCAGWSKAATVTESSWARRSECASAREHSTRRKNGIKQNLRLG